MTLSQELEVVDQQIAALEDQRAEIIGRLELNPTSKCSKLIQFPKRDAVRVRIYAKAANSHIW